MHLPQKLNLLRSFLLDLSPRTILLMIKAKSLQPALMLYRNVHFYISKSASITHHSGQLSVGPKWENGRYRESEFKISSGGRVEIDGIINIYTGCYIDIASQGVLSFRGDCFINTGSHINVFHHISFGKKVFVASGVTFRDSDNHQITGASKPVSAPIIVGDNVWIGLNATILKGVTIGKGSVIAAGSVVIHDVPENTLVGGVPAKVLRNNVSWEP